jgi:hypothetical protein
MNASGAHILYLIKADGTVIVPNTSENSLYDNRGNFESGERVSISSQTTSTSGDTNFRNIIRGGTRIEPILYNQIGHTPASWAPSINLTDINQIGSGSITGDYQALLRPPGYYFHTDGVWEEFHSTIILSSGSDATGALPLVGSYYRYKVTPGMVNDGISL